MIPRRIADTDWGAYFFDSKMGWPDRLEAMARRRFGPSPDAAAAANHALDAISADGWKRVTDGYKGRGSRKAFVAITLKNLLEDYAVQKYGRKRPPAWIKRLGSLWKRVHQMLCLQRMPPETIVEHICAGTARAGRDVREIVRQIKGRVPDCGQFIGEYLDDEGTATSDPIDETHSPAERLLDVEWQILVDALRSTLNDSDNTGEVGRPDLTLSDDERLLLRLVYHEGLSIPKAAKALKLHEQKARRMHRSTINRLQEELTNHGF